MNYADSTVKEINDFFETIVENLEPKEDRKKSSAAAKKSNDKKCTKNRKRADSDPRVIESSEESSQSVQKYYILHEKYSHSKVNCNDLHAMVNMHK